MLYVEYNKSLESSHKQEQHVHSKRVTVPLPVSVYHDAQRRCPRPASTGVHVCGALQIN